MANQRLAWTAVLVKKVIAKWPPGLTRRWFGRPYGRRTTLRQPPYKVFQK